MNWDKKNSDEKAEYSGVKKHYLNVMYINFTNIIIMLLYF